MSDEELEAHGGNVSMTHVDFMVGSNKLCIEATTTLGEKFLVLKDGEWAFQIANYMSDTHNIINEYVPIEK